ncbi:MAG: hypothetical protein FWH54_06175 [Methanobrevibacter sp.]|nr:hypothetical protein [Methanobrevibacter sp.]
MNLKMKNILIILLIATLAISMLSAVSAKNITINSKTSGGLKKAIDTAKNGDTIILKNGVYKGKNNVDLTIYKNITIKGKGSKVVLDGQGKKQIFYISSKKISIEKIQFKNGKSNTNGGAIQYYPDKGTLNVKNCVFTNNKANIQAGAIGVTFSAKKVTISGCKFTNNKANKCGGAIFMSEGPSYTVSKCTFTSNKADEGGAIWYNPNVKTVKLTIKDSNFKKNSARNAAAIFGKYIGKNVKISP